MYEPGSRYADENLTFVRGFAKDVERYSRTFAPQLAQRERHRDRRAEREARRTEVALIEPYRTPAQLDRLAQNPTLKGRTLLIGSSSTVGVAPKLKGTIETEAKESRSIVEMNERLRQMPLDRLRSFDRVVLQGGVKNTDRDDPNINKSLRAIDAMVDYLRENAPNVKIYVLEVTPWNAHYDPKIREFNDHLNAPEFRAKVAGIIPTYSIMDNGEGRS